MKKVKERESQILSKRQKQAKVKSIIPTTDRQIQAITSPNENQRLNVNKSINDFQHRIIINPVFCIFKKHISLDYTNLLTHTHLLVNLKNQLPTLRIPVTSAF